MINSLENLGVPVEGPEAEIMVIRDEIAAMGANSSEFEDIDKILEAYRKGDLEGPEAVSRAAKVRDSKDANF